MSENGLTKEKAALYNKLQNKEVAIVNPVMLKSLNKKTGEVKLSGPLEEEMVEVWKSRALREHSVEIMDFEIVEVGYEL